MKIKAYVCDGTTELEDFLNYRIDYKGLRPEHIILGITQERCYYTVVYKDYIIHDSPVCYYFRINENYVNLPKNDTTSDKYDNVKRN